LEIKSDRKGATQFAPLSNLHKIVDTISIRRDSSRKQGLIEAIEAKFNIKLNKPQLDIELVMTLIEKRIARPNVKQKTPLENFILKSGELILFNHQPIGKDHQKRNLETGLLG
jgi:hypothetical protein